MLKIPGKRECRINPYDTGTEYICFLAKFRLITLTRIAKFFVIDA